MSNDRRYVLKKLETNRTIGWCEFCDGMLDRGIQIAKVEWGPNRIKDWGRAHIPCAKEHPGILDETISREEAAQGDIAIRDVDAKRLPRGEYEHRERYAVMVDKEEIFRTANADKAEGVVDFLRTHPRWKESK